MMARNQKYGGIIKTTEAVYLKPKVVFGNNENENQSNKLLQHGGTNGIKSCLPNC